MCILSYAEKISGDILMYSISCLFMDISFHEHISMPLCILGSIKAIMYSCIGCTLHKGITSHIIEIIELYIYDFSVSADRNLSILFQKNEDTMTVFGQMDLTLEKGYLIEIHTVVLYGLAETPGKTVVNI